MLEYVRQVLNGLDIAFKIRNYFALIVVANLVEGAETDYVVFKLRGVSSRVFFDQTAETFVNVVGGAASHAVVGVAGDSFLQKKI